MSVRMASLAEEPGREIAAAAGAGTLIVAGAAVAAAALPVAEALAAASSDEVATAALGTVRILCVDDETANRVLMRRMLERLGVTCEMLTDGDEVVPRLIEVGMLPPPASEAESLVAVAAPAATARPPTRDYFAAIFLDIVMVRSSGDEVCRDLRSQYGLAIPIVAATANAGGVADQRLLTAGFSRILPKPFTVPQLAALLTDLRLLPAPAVVVAVAAKATCGGGSKA